MQRRQVAAGLVLLAALYDVFYKEGASALQFKVLDVRQSNVNRHRWAASRPSSHPETNSFVEALTWFVSVHVG